MTFHKIDWRKDSDRKKFEENLQRYREERANRTTWQKLYWFLSIIVLNGLEVFFFYGTCCYYIIQKHEEIKETKEIEMKDAWMRNRSTTEDEIPKFEYYDLENHFFINYYIYMTASIQTTAFFLFASFHWIDYRMWNLVGNFAVSICLPVDCLILYTEPLGPIGTLFFIVFAFVPFLVVGADASFPEREALVSVNGKITKKILNSWTGHLSLSYNQRYSYVVRATWMCHVAFSSIALAFALLQGTTEEFILGMIVLGIEVVPQSLRLVVGMVQWEADFELPAIDIFVSAMDIWLCIWYLSFYCSPRTKYAVIAKILIDSMINLFRHYAEYVEKYIYVEEPVEEQILMPITTKESRWASAARVNPTDATTNGNHEIDSHPPYNSKDEAQKNGYDNTNLANVLFYHALYIFLCPFIGLREIWEITKMSLTRDFGWFSAQRSTK